MEEFVYANGKKLRKGYTTGTCASGASLAALQLLMTKEAVEEIYVTTASGVSLVLPVKNTELLEDCAIAAIEKDGGDDADATHGMLIYAKVEWLDSEEIVIEGGEGIGRVTQKGLPVPPGEAAINPVPRRMIRESIQKMLPTGKGLRVTIFAPEGLKRSKQTYNSRLGIVGGISILGTTGIVTPMSEDGWKTSISLELAMKFEQGFRKIVLTPGNYGEEFVKNNLDISTEYIVNMSNFVGHVLKEVQRIGYTHVLIVGHIGKLIKVAGGIFSTHSKDADARNEILIANLALLGASQELLFQIDQCSTTEAAGDYIAETEFEKVYPVLVSKIKERSEGLLRYHKHHVEVDAILFSSQRGLLASTKPLIELEGDFQ